MGHLIAADGNASDDELQFVIQMARPRKPRRSAERPVERRARRLPITPLSLVATTRNDGAPRKQSEYQTGTRLPPSRPLSHRSPQLERYAAHPGGEVMGS
jgi:hypothetical protein